MPATPRRQDNLNRMAPAAAKAKLGDTLNDLIVSHNALLAQYNLLLAHIDAGAVAGLGTANAATYGAPSTPVVNLESRAT